MCIGQFSRASDFFRRRIRFAVGDVLPNRGAEQQSVLQHETDLIAQRLQLVAAYVRAVNCDGTRHGIVEARNQAHERSFPGAGRTHNRRDLPRFDLEADVLQYLLIVSVAEPDLVEFNLPFELGRPARASARRGFRFRCPELPECARIRPSPSIPCQSSSRGRAWACTCSPDTAGI